MMEDLAFYSQGCKPLSVLITILASVVIFRLLTRDALGIGSMTHTHTHMHTHARTSHARTHTDMCTHTTHAHTRPPDSRWSLPHTHTHTHTLPIPRASRVSNRNIICNMQYGWCHFRLFCIIPRPATWGMHFCDFGVMHSIWAILRVFVIFGGWCHSPCKGCVFSMKWVLRAS